MTTDWSEDNIPDQSGRVAFITGANTGIGFEAARALSARGARVLLGCRNTDKAEDAADRIRAANADADVDVVRLDLADLSSVEAAAATASNEPRLDLLINNAGIMAPPRSETADGFESQMGVNHLGHFALTGHLIQKLNETDSARVVTVSSGAHSGGRIHLDDLQATRRYGRIRQYCNSKLANLLFTYELARRLEADNESTLAVAAHPGMAETELGRDVPWVFRVTEPISRRMTQSAQMGALPTLRAAVDPDASSGDYFGPNGRSEMGGPPVVVTSSARSMDDEMAKALWDLSERLTGISY